MAVLGAKPLPLFDAQKFADILMDAASHVCHVAKTNN
jgi:hypothetical protein